MKLEGCNGDVKETYRIDVCPPKSQTWNLMFLYVTVSTLKPIVGMVDTTSPICNRYKMVVLPALSSPSMSILTSSFLFQNANLENIEENVTPILTVSWRARSPVGST